MKAAELTLATLLALAADFHNGLECLKQKQYDKAITAFTNVISAEPSVNEMKEFALFHRAEAYTARAHKTEALKDLGAVIKSTKNAQLLEKAIKQYTAASGELKNLRPADGPSKTMGAFLAAVTANDEKKAMEHLANPLLHLIETMDMVFSRHRERTWLSELGREFGRIGIGQEMFDDTNRTATLTVTIGGGEPTFVLGLTQENGKWVFSSVRNIIEGQREARGNAGDSSIPGGNLNRLSQIGGAIRRYAMEHNGVNPPKLQDITEHLPDRNILWRDPNTGATKEFLYRPDQTNSSYMVAAAPEPTQGMREILLLYGNAQMISEEQFRSRAESEQWLAVFPVQKDDVPKKTQEEIRALIGRLEHGDSAQRAAARKRLKEIGAPAVPFLEEERENADPEVQAAVKELLGGR